MSDFYFTILVDCVWGNWSSYGQCNSTSGKQSRSRSKTIVERNGGTCLDPSSETIDCEGEKFLHSTITHYSPYDWKY